MGMTVRLTDGRVTVTVEGVEEAKRMQDGQAVPLAAEPEAEPERCTPERRTCLPDHTKWCGQSVDGWMCSRAKGHTGPHIACNRINHNLTTSAPPAPEPPVADLRSGPDMLLIAQLVKAIRRRAETIGEVSIAADCEQIQKELTK